VNEELEQLFDRAVALPLSERATFVATVPVTGEKIRAELHSLVAAAEGAEHFFERLARVALSPAIMAQAVDDAAAHSDPPRARLLPEQHLFDAGTVIGRYNILGLLGRGGMATVYRAHDTQLDRDVALKFLHPTLSLDAGAEDRLLGEARAAAALQHSNICVVHEIGETPSGKRFIAMGLCDGETLKQRLATGALAPDRAVAIATQVARALDAAHAGKIVHRDVKPGNIIVGGDGTTKLLDFGLAMSSDVSVERPGSTPGTVSYMSPEQVRGEPLDQRTDLWSLGVVLYEMLTGRRPFRGDSDRAILNAILHDEPEPLPGISTGIPAHIGTVVNRLLTREREARYQSAAALLADLARGPHLDAAAKTRRRAVILAGIGTLALTLVTIIIWSSNRANAAHSAFMAEPSLAVLPLANLSGDSLYAAVVAGVTEELISTLASVGNVRVIASTSTSAFKNKKLDIRQIAESLGVSNVLEGGIRKTDSQLRIDVRLIAARDGSTKWSQSYNREFKDVFLVQDDIVRAVAGELGLRFDANRQLRRHHTRSVVAYELYLHGADPLLLRSQSGAWKALQYFQQAIAADSTYAAAYAGMALVQVRRGRTTSDPGMPLRQLFGLAEKSARKAVSLDDSLPEAHYALGRVEEAMLHFQAAESEIRRAIALDPTRSIYHRALAYVLEWVGEPEDLLAETHRALETDPLNPYGLVASAGALAANRRCDEALVELNKVSAMQPPLQGAAFVTAQCYAQQKRLPEAIATLRPQAEAGDPMFRGLLGNLLAKAGHRDEATKVLADLLHREKQTGVGAFQVAMVHAGLGDSDNAFAWLDRSVDDRSIGSVIRGPAFEELHADPRFEKLEQRLGLPKR
jgi:serine/threonine protein kinase/predicted Zn-dependent protease